MYTHTHTQKEKSPSQGTVPPTTFSESPGAHKHVEDGSPVPWATTTAAAALARHYGITVGAGNPLSVSG